MTSPTYSVLGPSGRPLMVSQAGIRYAPGIELSLISSGCTVRLNGKKLSRKENMKDYEKLDSGTSEPTPF